jgi:PD-(D/E)XK nuclease superfamily
MIEEEEENNVHQYEDGLLRVGNSEISAWSQCRRKWWLSYYVGLTDKEPKLYGALALGTRVHAALEGYYRKLMAGDTSADLIKIHSGLVEADRLELIMGGHSEGDLDKDADLGRVMLEDFLQWQEEDALDAGLDIIGVEHSLSHVLVDGRAVLSGKIDLMAVDKFTRVPHMIDWKTAANFQSLLTTAHMAPQLKTYVALYAMNHPELPESALAGTYRILKKSKRTARALPPFHMEHTVRFNREALNNHLTNLASKIEEIVATRDKLDAGSKHQQVVPPTVSSLCNWACPFLAICPMFDDGSAVQDAIDERYVTRDPYDYRQSDSLLDML